MKESKIVATVFGTFSAFYAENSNNPYKQELPIINLIPLKVSLIQEEGLVNLEKALAENSIAFIRMFITFSLFSLDSLEQAERILTSIKFDPKA